MTIQTFEAICLASIVISGGIVVACIVFIETLEFLDRVSDWIKGR